MMSYTVTEASKHWNSMNVSVTKYCVGIKYHYLSHMMHELEINLKNQLILFNFSETALHKFCQLGEHESYLCLHMRDGLKNYFYTKVVILIICCLVSLIWITTCQIINES